MVRRNAPSRRSLVYWFGAPIAILVMAACSGYLHNDDPINWFSSPGCPSREDGSLAIPKECCPCPWPDMCPNGWPEVPAYCRTGCEPGQPIECCECPTDAWCAKEAQQHFRAPEWCKDKPWLLDGGAEAGSAVCPIGMCVPKLPDGWKGPATLHHGWDIEVPACPEGSTTMDGWAAPPPPTCAECACSTPKSICGSSPEWTVSSRGCDDFDSGVKWDFSPPADWDGSCNSDKALAAGKLCGNEGYCAKSITIAPPKLEQIDKSCTPFVNNQDELPPLKFHNGINGGPDVPIGRVCVDEKTATDLPTCGVNNEKVCREIPIGMACIAREGDHTCPEGWAQKYTFYQHIEDSRSCSECSCGPAEGATCVRKYRLFTDSTCATEYGSWTTDDASLPQCQWLSDGTALASKTLEIVEHTLGSCAPSGGEVSGEVKLNDPFTVCCVATDM
jgi:hypothetical protein